jgi:hypothetical protein
MKNGVRVEMDQFDLVVDKKVAEEITGWVSKSALEEEVNTTVSLVLCVGMSSLVAGHHCSTSRSRRRKLATSVRISLSLAMDG